MESKLVSGASGEDRVHEDVQMEEVPGYKAFPGNLSNEMFVSGVTSKAKSMHNHANTYRTEA